MSDPTRNYQLDLDDESYTAGAGGEWGLLEGDLLFKGEYSVSLNESMFSHFAGTNPQ